MSERLEIIKSRKSIRTFDGKPLGAKDRTRLERYAETIENPFGVPVRFIFLDADENGLSSPVISGEHLYVAGIVDKSEHADAAFGYAFEKFVLYAWSIGIGTTWIAGTMKREVFERAAGLSENMRMPCVSPLGYPAKKKSLKESMMRKSIGADGRLSAEQFLFDGVWGAPLKVAGTALAEPAEMVRWAPSAVNKQPWRILYENGNYHFYEKQDKGFVSDRTGDLQKIDVGIALCHFVMGIEEQKKQPSVVVQNPGIAVPGGVNYVATVRCAL